MDGHDEGYSNPTRATPIGDLIALRLSRRAFIGGALATSGLATACASLQESGTSRPAFQFAEIARGMDETHHVPAGYAADILIRWGDPLFTDSPPFDPLNQTGAAQSRQFGYNCDYIGYVALAPRRGEDARALLCVNHEYTTTRMMLPGVAAGFPDSLTRSHFEIEMAAHGGSIVEISRRGGVWSPVVPSKYNRRITAETPMDVAGPAAGHDRLKTSADPEGRVIAGTLYNCAGGVTPWGTYLMAEENIHGYFLGKIPDGHRETDNHRRYGVPAGWYHWGRSFERFDISKEPNEPNRFGWIVEVDPLDPGARPKKRTALGRFKHEGAESVVAPNGRVVLYSGDDEQFEYVYKFVTARSFNPDAREANMNLLDDGVLYAARFNADGSLDWLPLVFGEGELTPANGFHSQADILIEARRAADAVGATPMDRPEDVEPDARSGRVWVMLTNNSRRAAEQTNAANPRGPNHHGHIIEIIEPDGDFTATRSRWDVLVKCGDPADPALGAAWNPAISKDGWFGSPDNCAVDPKGRLWVATDGNEGAADGVWALETDGPLRGLGRAFFRAPVGAEVCGPRFAPDARTLFVAVQHPGDDRGLTFETPSTRWPDFNPDLPPRASVVAIRRQDGREVGS